MMALKKEDEEEKGYRVVRITTESGPLQKKQSIGAHTSKVVERVSSVSIVKKAIQYFLPTYNIFLSHTMTAVFFSSCV